MQRFSVIVQSCRGLAVRVNFPVQGPLRKTLITDVAAEIARLTPSQVSAILRKKEASQVISHHPLIKKVDVNQLPANNPIEDTYNAAFLPANNDLVVAVYDGHGGPACSHTIAHRLFSYLAAEMLPKETLERYLRAVEQSEQPVDLTSPLNDLLLPVSQQQANAQGNFMDFIFKNSLGHYISDLSKGEGYKGDARVALERSFFRLDSDIQNEPIKNNWLVDSLSAAFSGSTACLAYIEGKTRIHVANVGDSRAVIGRRDPVSGQWRAIPLSREHNAENLDEIRRIYGEHPPGEKSTVIRDSRLLGSLAPLRAFGDVHFKWSNETMQKLAEALRSQRSRTQDNGFLLYRHKNYLTPPYLTAKPEIITHNIRRGEDAFLILATDGLWEWVDAQKAVQFIGEHCTAAEVKDEFEPPANITLKELHDLLQQRAGAIKNRTQDSNSATHLIRAALGWSLEAGGAIRHIKLSNILSVSGNPRQYRDDISVIVLFFKMSH